VAELIVNAGMMKRGSEGETQLSQSYAGEVRSVTEGGELKEPIPLQKNVVLNREKGCPGEGSYPQGLLAS